MEFFHSPRPPKVFTRLAFYVIVYFHIVLIHFLNITSHFTLVKNEHQGNTENTKDKTEFCKTMQRTAYSRNLIPRASLKYVVHQSS